MNRYKGMMYGLGAAILFALMNVIVKASVSCLPTAEILFARGIGGLILLTPFVLKSIPLLCDRKHFLVWVRCLAGTLAALALLYNIEMSGAGFAALFANMAILFVVFFSVVFFRESLSKVEWVGMSLTVGGVFVLYALLSSSTLFFSPVGILVGLLGAFCGGVAMVALKQMAVKFPPLLIVWGFCLFCGLSSLCFFNATWTCDSASHLLILVTCSLLGLFGQICLTQSYVHLPAIVASLMSLSTILWSIVFESLYLRSVPDSFSLISYGIILIGLIILQIGYAKKPVLKRLS